MDPYFFKIILAVQLNVVDLRGVLSEHEDHFFSRNEVLSVAPLRVEVVGAVILALQVHEENGVGLHREGRQIT